ncbi:MAG: DNA mismatch repair endonuclease MutL [Thermodesulfobacteriota bacterium]
MGKIRILPDILVSKIAAGEVVERPASVVKELLENAVDADSTNITVQLKSGGKSFIRIIDNGHGMTRDDALMSLERHATSKIKNVEDLFSLKTLGFRGEALPSIASVSRFTLSTKTKQKTTGTEIYIEGGIIKSVKEKGMNEGTSIEVKNLFFNTKPRLNFLRKPQTELLKILEVIQREAICCPEISFEVFSDDMVICHYTSKKVQIDRIIEIIPNTELYRIELRNADILIEGYLSSPLETRTSMQRLYTYVNGRPLKDRFINRLIMDSYGNLIEKGHFPQGVLLISVNPKDVDVNVHPTKSEVKFQNQYLASESIKSAVKKMLREAPWIKGYKERTENALINFYQNNRSKSDYKGNRYNKLLEDFHFNERDNQQYSKEDYEDGTFKQDSYHHKQEIETETEILEPGKGLYKAGYYSGLKYIGQIGKLYLLCETESGIIIVDQHAAHERVNFERIKRAYVDSKIVQSQELLIPQVLELNSLELGVADQFNNEIKNLGFNIAVFGRNTVRLSSVPAFLLNSSYKEIFLNLLHEINNLGEGKNIKDKLDLVCATIACHGSIRANRKLQQKEVEYLFSDLDKCDFPHACPHGRPIVTEISYNSLEKMFRRT